MSAVFAGRRLAGRANATALPEPSSRSPPAGRDEAPAAETALAATPAYGLRDFARTTVAYIV